MFDVRNKRKLKTHGTLMENNWYKCKEEKIPESKLELAMKNPTLNKDQQEIKTEKLTWKLSMLEAATTCLRMYIKTKDERFFKLYEELKLEADSWDKESLS